jgi:hypothetical protein
MNSQFHSFAIKNLSCILFFSMRASPICHTVREQYNGIKLDLAEEQFKDSIWEIRRRTDNTMPKGKGKKDKQRSIKHTQKAKHGVRLTPLNRE